jgi:glycosyltransferase involved in cell wall biosynthesis
MDGSPHFVTPKRGGEDIGYSGLDKGSSPRRVRRSLLVSASYSAAEIDNSIGKEAYSYYFVARAFAPLLGRLGATSGITRPESRLDYAVWRAERQGLEAIHLSFLPVHLAYLSSRVPNVAFPSWEFPDIPSVDLAGNPRNNWARIANHFSLIVCHSRTAREAFLKAGVTAPVRLVPVPLQSHYFSLPQWEPGQSMTLDCPCFELPEPRPTTETLADAAEELGGLGARGTSRHAYRRFVKPYLAGFLDRSIWRAACAAGLVPKRRPEEDIPCKLRPSVRLSGIVYTTIFNPFDPRKNWQDLLTSFLLAFREQADVTLVVKLAIRPAMLRQGLLEVFEFYRNSGLSHRCKVVLIWSYLSEPQMLGLTRASTFYVNASRAEGSCLPLQNFLASGRPGIAPVHSGLADYFDEHVGFAVESHPEPAAFPHDPEKRLLTSWHRLVWSSLHEQLIASYRFVRDGYQHYRAMGERARQSMEEYSREEAVWPKLSEALESVSKQLANGGVHPAATSIRPGPTNITAGKNSEAQSVFLDGVQMSAWY